MEKFEQPQQFEQETAFEKHEAFTERKLNSFGNSIAPTLLKVLGGVGITASGLNSLATVVARVTTDSAVEHSGSGVRGVITGLVLIKLADMMKKNSEQKNQELNNLAEE